MATRKTTTSKPAATTYAPPTIGDGITRGWKTLHGELSADGSRITSDYDGSSWTVGEWRTAESAYGYSEVATCRYGFHMSPTPSEAFGYVQGSILALVEARGESASDSSKSAHKEMRILAAWPYGYNVNNKFDALNAEIMSAVRETYPDNDDAWTAFYTAESAANTAWRNAVQPLNEAFRSACEPINERFDSLISEARKTARQVKEDARTAYYKAVNAADDACTAAVERFESERHAAIAPAEAVRTMQEFPHTKAMQAATAKAAEVRDAAIAEAEVQAEAKRAEIQNKTLDKALQTLGKPVVSVDA